MQTLFAVLLSTYLMLIVIETIYEGSVSPHINLNHLLIIVTAVGLVVISTGLKIMERVRGERLTTRALLMIICISVSCAVILWYKTSEIGWFSFFISFLIGSLVALLSLIIWEENREGKKQG